MILRHAGKPIVIQRIDPGIPDIEGKCPVPAAQDADACRPHAFARRTAAGRGKDQIVRLRDHLLQPAAHALLPLECRSLRKALLQQRDRQRTGHLAGGAAADAIAHAHQQIAAFVDLIDIRILIQLPSEPFVA